MIRFFDIVFCSLAILFMSPLLIFIIVILKFSGEGEIFYLQKRVGYQNNNFNLIKFVTMKKDSEITGTGTITIKNDPRVLPFGKLLRKSKINELPQLINVIKGDMSIVGPRPLTRKNFEYYNFDVKKKLIQIKPGLSGIGSIFFRNEEDYLKNLEDPEEVYKKYISPYKGDLELWFVNNKNLKNYFYIILTTIITIFINNQNFMFKIFPDLPVPNENLISLIQDD